MKKDLLLIVTLVSVAALGIGIVVLIAFWQGEPEKPPTVAPKTVPIAELPKKIEPAKRIEPVRKPEPKKVVIPEQKPPEEKKVEPEEKKIEEKKIEEKNPEVAKLEPKIEIKPELKKEVVGPKVIVLDNIFKINDPDGEFTVDGLKRGKEIILLGKVKTLRVTTASEGATLNAHEFDAQEVILANVNGGAKILLGKTQSLKIADVNNSALIDAVALSVNMTGNINSGSTVKLQAPKGTIEITGELNDRATLDIDAPDGKVLFNGRGASGINGNAKVKIVAREVELRGAVNGPQTRIELTLTKNGTLKFERLHGGTQLLYRKADAGDPEPRVDAGEVNPQAEFRKVP